MAFQETLIDSEMQAVFEEFMDSRKNLATELENVKELALAAIQGQWETRGDAGKFSGGYKEIVEGVNATLDTVVDKMVWYEAIIDAVPFPIHVTDNDMKWIFMNKSFEAMMMANGVITDRASGCGMDCYNAERVSGMTSRQFRLPRIISS